MRNLTGKIAFVSGASRGIGQAVALRLAGEGASVILHYSSNRDAADATVKKIERNGGHALALQADFRTTAGIEELIPAFEQALRQLSGDTRFDILVNNAGICHRGKIEDTSAQLFDEVMTVNVKAPFFLTQRLLPMLRDGARIINLSSVVTRSATPDITAYTMSKSAINGFTLTLAKQLGARGITVNALLPGVVDTDMNASLLQDEQTRSFIASLSSLGRLGEPSDIADAAAFLASSDSRWVTGQLIDVSGGLNL